MLLGTCLIISVLANFGLLYYVVSLNKEIDDYELLTEKQDKTIRNYLAKDYIQESRYIKQDYDAQG